jgi:hypothetical protein
MANTLISVLFSRNFAKRLAKALTTPGAWNIVRPFSSPLPHADLIRRTQISLNSIGQLTPNLLADSILRRRVVCG